MYVRIRKADGQSDEFSVVVSGANSVETLKDKICSKLLEREGKSIKLYFRGKQLVDDHQVMDYNINGNDVVQMMTIDVKDMPSTSKTKPSQTFKEPSQPHQSTEQNDYQSAVSVESQYYKVGDLVDYLDNYRGCWYEGIITKIIKADKEPNSAFLLEPSISFVIRSDSEDDHETILQQSFDCIQPRSRKLLSTAELEMGEIVLINYNLENPEVRGQWYKFVVQQISRRFVIGTIYLGEGMKCHIDNCSIKNVHEIFRIEKPFLHINRPKFLKAPPRRKNAYLCATCKDDNDKKCYDCGCMICRGKKDWGKIILCDDCNGEYHIYCLTPPLQAVPSECQWFCPDCKTNPMEIVQAGEKLKSCPKRKRLNSSNSRLSKSRKTYVRSSTECAVVPKDHYGPIPGVAVGTCWKMQSQVAKAGVHTPTAATIHGRESDGVFSLMVSGGYDEDQDFGEEFLYAISGERYQRQKCIQGSEQFLIGINRALALNCNAIINDQVGAEAKDWKAGKPIRIVRFYKKGEQSAYSPKNGFRYDGIYKVVKYYREQSKSGFVIWKYLLKRDDPEPAPWIQDGHKLDIICPNGSLDIKCEQNGGSSEIPQKIKQIPDFKLTEAVEYLISEDVDNEKVWNDCLANKDQGFLQKVRDNFMCICCRDLVYNPITTYCKHNICKRCLKRAFAAAIYTCPCCRRALNAVYPMEVNEILRNILLALFPGYEARR